MFVNYYTTTVENTITQLVSNNSDTQLIIVSIQIYSGQLGGILTLRKKDNVNSVVAFQQKISILSNSPMVIQHKILLPVSYSLQVESNVSGIQVCVNGVKESV